MSENENDGRATEDKSGWVDVTTKEGHTMCIFVFCQKDIEALKPSEEDYACVHVALKKDIPFADVTSDEIAAQVKITRERQQCLETVAERQGFGNMLWKVSEKDIIAEIASRHPVPEPLVALQTPSEKPKNLMQQFLNTLGL